MEPISLDLTNLVLQTYPAPIALAWRNYLRSSNKKEEHDHLLDLLEISTMYLATAFISQYRQDNYRINDIEKELMEVDVASFGTWKSLIQKISSLYIENPTDSIIRLFAEGMHNKEQSPQFQLFIKEISKVIGMDATLKTGNVSITIVVKKKILKWSG